MTKPPPIKHFRPFLVCEPHTFKDCLSFYSKIGCNLLWESDNAAEFSFGEHQRFLVTLHHGLVPTRVGVFHLEVDDVDAWHKHMTSIDFGPDFQAVKISDPEITEWNWQLFYVWDPAGTLLHIGRPLAAPS